MPEARNLIYLRVPVPSEPELVISRQGDTQVIRLTRDQVDKLAIQMVRAAVEWPE